MSSSPVPASTPDSHVTNVTLYSPQAQAEVIQHRGAPVYDDDADEDWVITLSQPMSIIDMNWTPPTDEEVPSGRSLLDIVDNFRPVVATTSNVTLSSNATCFVAIKGTDIYAFAHTAHFGWVSSSVFPFTSSHAFMTSPTSAQVQSCNITTHG